LKDKNKKQEQLINGLIKLRQRIAELEASESKHKRAAEVIKSSEQWLRMLFENAPDAYFISDLKGGFVDGNKTAEKMIGYKKEKLIGKNLLKLKLLPPEQISKATSILAKSANGKPAGPDEFILNRKDGTQAPVEIRTFPVKIKDKHLVLGIVRDITKQKCAEEALRESEAFNFALFQYNPVETIAVDRDGRIVKTNLATRKTKEKWPNIGDLMYKDYIRKHEIDMYANLMETINSGEKKEFPELKYRDNYLSITIAPFPDGAIITSHDITKRKKAEMALVESEEKLREQKLALEEKNIALREIIAQIEIEKIRLKEDIENNVNIVLSPILEKLKLGKDRLKHINLLEHYIEKITSSFGSKITRTELKLTSREIEVCNMIKSGLTSKDISSLLNISYRTVEKHRENIRHKLEIANKDVNLATFLREL